MSVNCDYCQKEAKLVKGDIIYPHRKDLYNLNFWHCEDCDAYVGCHKKNDKYNKKGTEPLGRLANQNLRSLKSQAHKVFDPYWRNGNKSRKECYAQLSKKMNIAKNNCHIGMFSENQCKKVIKICKDGLFDS